MKYLKIVTVTVLAALTFSAAQAQVHHRHHHLKRHHHVRHYRR